MASAAPTAKQLKSMSAAQAVKALTKESVELSRPGGAPRMTLSKDEAEAEATRIVNEHLPKLQFVSAGYNFTIPIVPQRVKKKLFPLLEKKTMAFGCDIVHFKHDDGSVETRMRITKEA